MLRRVRPNAEDGREDLEEMVGDFFANILELPKLGVVSSNDIVVDGHRVPVARDVATADPVLLVVVTIAVFVDD